MEYCLLLARVDRILLTRPLSVPIRYTIPIALAFRVRLLHLESGHIPWIICIAQIAIEVEMWNLFNWLGKYCCLLIIGWTNLQAVTVDSKRCCVCCLKWNSKWNNNSCYLTNWFYWKKKSWLWYIPLILITKLSQKCHTRGQTWRWNSWHLLGGPSHPTTRILQDQSFSVTLRGAPGCQYRKFFFTYCAQYRKFFLHIV